MLFLNDLNLQIITIKNDRKIFLILILISLTIFVFTSDAHRFTIDETYPQDQAKVIITMEPHPLYVQGESKMLFQYPEMFPPKFTRDSSICSNFILCFPTYIGHTITELPFVFLNYHLDIITSDTVSWSGDDFDQPHYVFWRNGLDPDFTFMELFYGPIFSALSVGVFYLLGRSYSYTPKTSVTLALLFGLSTILWAYSQTSLNNNSVAFFTLLGLYYFRRFRLTHSTKSILLSGIILGFAILVRQDAILFAVVVFVFLLIELRSSQNKIIHLISYVVTTGIFYGIHTMIPLLRYNSQSSDIGNSTLSIISQIGRGPAIHESIFGLFFSPGVGLLIFVPLLWLTFMSFPEFYKKHKTDSLMLLSITTLFIIFYGTTFEFWQGYVAWGSRYLLPLVPLLLLPLGYSMEKRGKKFLTIVLILASLGFFINIVFVVQDVSWFVWSQPGSTNGLFGLCWDVRCPLYIHPTITWTFQYSQLTASVYEMFTHLQPDIFLLKLLGLKNYLIIFTIFMIVLSYGLKKSIHTTTK